VFRCEANASELAPDMGHDGGAGMSYSDNISKKEAARLVGCAESTLMRLVKNSYFPSPYKIGGKLCFSRKEILEWIEEQKHNKRVRSS
jgi:excisionase family DNA binding protein